MYNFRQNSCEFFNLTNLTNTIATFLRTLQINSFNSYNKQLYDASTAILSPFSEKETEAQSG